MQRHRPSEIPPPGRSPSGRSARRGARCCSSKRASPQTRVEDIAARAGLSKGAVYLYFPSKEAILEGLVKRAILPIANNALGMLDDYAGDPRPVISTALKMVAGRLSDPKIVAIPRLLIREIINFPEFAQMYRARSARPGHSGASSG